MFSLANSLFGIGVSAGDAAVPDLVGAAFILSGANSADEDEVMRRTSGGRNANGQPYPIPPSVYDKIRADRTRPIVAMTLRDVATANETEYQSS